MVREGQHTDGTGRCWTFIADAATAAVDAVLVVAVYFNPRLMILQIMYNVQLKYGKTMFNEGRFTCSEGVCVCGWGGSC
jgi:hypothetical protein